ncbi:MAG: hypothetical protein JST82_01515 [Bacteroidetes bacterium]|nr:hypothetical protein [Bacteroidota bacterium]
MAKKITIPVTNHSTGGVCTLYYKVDYKPSTESSYITLPLIYSSTIEIPNLSADVTYNILITRFCCDGLQSAPLALDVNT